MEKTMNKVRHMLGPRFARFKNGWFAGFGFYWFCVIFYRKCGPEIFSQLGYYRWTGIVLSWKPNPLVQPGDLIWLKSKRWGVYA